MFHPITPRYSVIVPTYRRQDVLALCLDHIARLDYSSMAFEVQVYDNGSPQDSRAVVEQFRDRLSITYTLNEPGHGLGYSLCRGIQDSQGQRIVELNDDALVPPDFLILLDEVFDSDPLIGIVGVRAIESGYVSNGFGIGCIDPKTQTVVGNFNKATDGPIDVEHVYGFCYAYNRTLLDAGGRHDTVLLAKDYSTGNRIETDQCLTCRHLGFRVVYDGRIGVTHLAKPRGDVKERSTRWRHNDIRNTLYLFLKHYGLFGKSLIATRYFFLHDPGVLSALKHPTRENIIYVWTGIVARCSAILHYTAYLVCGNRG